MFIHNRLGLIESVETMLAQEHRLNQVSNNLANVDTAGFKKERVTFWEMLYSAQEKKQRVGKALKLINNYQQGTLETTENPLDFAIEGEGFFRVQTAGGVRYTRNGNFHISNAGQVVTADGFPLLGQGGPVTVGKGAVTISPEGDVFVDGAVVDALAVVTFNDLQKLEKEGTNLFRVPAGEQLGEIEPEEFSVYQGFLERSNVNVTLELTEMIDLYRGYEIQQKLVQAVDELDGQAISKVGRLTA